MKADIGDKKIAADVHGFASNDSSVLPTPYPREEHANNGVLNPQFQHLSEKRDIGDNGIDAAVHGFASADKSVLPKPWRRAKEPYP